MNTTECLICYEKIMSNNCCVTECNHAFCLTCMIKTALKKKECPYCREKILKNEETGEEENEHLEDEEDEDENYAVEVNVEVFGDMEFSENGDSEVEINIGDLTLIAFSEIGYISCSYLKEIIEISIYKYLFYKNHHIDYVNKFKNCDFELFKEIPLIFGYSIECNDNEKKKIYDLFFKDSNDVYSFATTGSNFKQDKKKKNKSIKNIKKSEQELLKKAINEIKLIENKINKNKKNKSKKNKKEKVNKNRCLKF